MWMEAIMSYFTYIAYKEYLEVKESGFFKKNYNDKK